ncbi:CDP-diacylglycerol--glycerol-3-phosphate 3-phosphatidyltransferase [Jeotgalibaca caeni]|uniref:CDP-diacylglycerol--glycerol-3-phosphate 3-phosphatidyltransferase n=1 Tax=Jeotgalibaca caeni TaxID=3028623 RepID=UPI00237EC331|nr:CDP-diacylglycerol--glycerol-3-phosphate 3-phosphatidyltransferase [Jeotgalibaca caeni]MDE1547634.1 CDP-diacylglycerol--glycerol-3-phosphate 3-phosphatidyltransferase [Jeotgalibaca caeni]
MKKQLPNLLTILRLLLIPFYFIVFYSGSENATFQALLVFIAASITDVLDGYLARKYEVVSKFGTVADPFADKLMQISVLYTLSDADYLENWFFWIILVKEFSQIALGAVMVSMKPRIIIAANVFGKATTVLVFLTIILAVFEVPGINILQIIVTTLAIITFSQYALRFSQKLQKRKADEKR